MKKNFILNNKFLIQFLFIGFTLFFLFTKCKKYPENKGIHIIRPENRLQGNYRISLYTVDGVDSISFLNSRINGDITSLEWTFKLEDHNTKLLYSQYFGDGFYAFKNDNKILNIVFFIHAPSPTYWQIIPYNLFLEEGSNWEILKLYKKNDKSTLKLKRLFNGKTYVIQFN